MATKSQYGQQTQEKLATAFRNALLARKYKAKGSGGKSRKPKGGGS